MRTITTPVRTAGRASNRRSAHPESRSVKPQSDAVQTAVRLYTERSGENGSPTRRKPQLSQRRTARMAQRPKRSSSTGRVRFWHMSGTERRGTKRMKGLEPSTFCMASRADGGDARSLTTTNASIHAGFRAWPGSEPAWPRTNRSCQLMSTGDDLCDSEHPVTCKGRTRQTAGPPLCRRVLGALQVRREDLAAAALEIGMWPV